MTGFTDTSFLGNGPASAGPSSGFFDNLAGAWNQAWHVDASRGFQEDVQDNWAAAHGDNRGIGSSFDELGRLLGSDVLGVSGADPISMATKQRLGRPFESSELTPQAQAAFDQFNQQQLQLQTLKAQNPNIKTFDDVYNETVAQRREIQERSAQLAATSGIAGEIGGFLGGLPAISPDRTPFQFGSLFLGGAGESLAARIGIQALGQGTAAFAGESDKAPVQQALGETPDVRGDVLSAAAGGALFELGGAALGKGFKALKSKLFGDVNAPIGDLTPPELAGKPLVPEMTVSQRAAAYAQDTAQQLKDINPYGQDHAANLRMFDEGDAVVNQFDAQADLSGTTAIGRFLPDSFEIPHISSYDEALVGGEHPEIVDRLHAAQDKLAQASDGVTAAEQAIDGRTMADAVANVDPASGDLVRSYEADLQKPNLTSEARDAINDQLDKIVQSIGPDVIEKAENDAQIGLKHAVRSSRATLAAAKKELSKAQGVFTTRADSMKAELAVKQRLQGIVAPGDSAPITKSVLDYSPIISPFVRRDVVEASAQALDASEAGRDASIKHTVDQGRPAEPVEPKEGAPAPEPVEKPTEYKLDDGTTIPHDFMYDFGNGPQSAASAFDDMHKDDALVEAMGTCSL